MPTKIGAKSRTKSISPVKKKQLARKTEQNTTGKMSPNEAAMKNGIQDVPDNDPIYKGGWQIGASKPYKPRAFGSKQTASSTPEKKPHPMQPAVDSMEQGLQEAMAKGNARLEAQKKP